jgi:diguanylate cyclase (GGDEF)-like protein
VFVFDCQHAVGVAAASPYVTVVLAGLMARSGRMIFGFAVLVTILTSLGYFLSPADHVSLEPFAPVLNRLLTLLSIWTLSLVARRFLIVEGRLRERLVAQATLDELTGVANRRKVFVELRRSLAESERHREPTSVLVLDVDHFKRVNDTWGHQIGDRALTRVARLIQEQLREVDVLGRIGGEEFLVVLPRTSVEGARHVAERIRAHVAADPGPPRVTLSIGLAQAPVEHAEALAVVRAADRALYRAKAAGRNRVGHARRVSVQRTAVAE